MFKKKKKRETGEEKITKKFALVHTLEKKIKLKNNPEGINCLSFEVFVNGHELVFALLVPIFFI